MCKSISSDVIIGNLLIEAMERDVEQISFNQLLNFDEQISIAINDTDYSTKFSINNIHEFECNYPFFVTISNENHLRIVKNKDHTGKEVVINRLIRYFRIGLPKSVVNQVDEVSALIFG